MKSRRTNYLRPLSPTTRSSLVQEAQRRLLNVERGEMHLDATTIISPANALTTANLRKKNRKRIVPPFGAPSAPFFFFSESWMLWGWSGIIPLRVYISELEVIIFGQSLRPSYIVALGDWIDQLGNVGAEALATLGDDDDTTYIISPPSPAPSFLGQINDFVFPEIDVAPDESTPVRPATFRIRAKKAIAYDLLSANIPNGSLFYPSLSNPTGGVWKWADFTVDNALLLTRDWATYEFLIPADVLADIDYASDDPSQFSLYFNWGWGHDGLKVQVSKLEILTDSTTEVPNAIGFSGDWVDQNGNTADLLSPVADSNNATYIKSTTSPVPAPSFGNEFFRADFSIPSSRTLTRVRITAKWEIDLDLTFSASIPLGRLSLATLNGSTYWYWADYTIGSDIVLTDDFEDYVIGIPDDILTLLGLL